MTSLTSAAAGATDQFFNRRELQLNLADIVEDLFMVLTSKEKDVVVKRFSLSGHPRQTLENIGKQFKVTRERVRQIEKIALNKLKRTVISSKLNEINLLAKEILTSNGGIMLESALISELLNSIYNSSKVDANIIKLTLSIDLTMEKIDRTLIFFPFWKTVDVPLNTINKVANAAYKFLEKTNEVVSVDELVDYVVNIFKLDQPIISGHFVKSVLKFDKRLKSAEIGMGLATWRHVNPKSIRDKAYIILKKDSKPMHFVEIANKISEVGFDRKMVTTQAVHNELIRHDQFVLVGRGLYALKEWGFQDGTVADIIVNLLKKKSPLTKQQIIKGVLKQRQVKKGTISLNLQKNDAFVRVGRAVYALKQV